MHVQDFEESRIVKTANDRAQFLSKRYFIDGAHVNSFDLSHGNPYPIMCLWIREDLASAWYTPREEDAGFIPVGTSINLDEDGFTDFFYSKEKHPRPNTCVITLADALRVAEEFRVFAQLPTSISWLEL
jgi:hypothetical protein